MDLFDSSPESHRHIVQTSSPTKHNTSKDKKTLLLAEDDHDLLLVMEYTLSSMGYLVVACADAQLALAAFRTQAFNALVTDFEMPGKTGLELARELTSFQPDLPVLVITGSTLSDEVQQELVDRQWVYMSKPSNLNVVEAVLNKLVRVQHPLAA